MPIGERANAFVREEFERTIVPALFEYIKIPNKSPMSDEDWHARGAMREAAELLAGWARTHLPPDATLEIVELRETVDDEEGWPLERPLTPVIFIEVPASGGVVGDTVLFYGHFDKQPEHTGWTEPLGPWNPVRIEDRLYGRGGADDGYAIFSAVMAIAALRMDDVPHARCVILIEGSEESGSIHLPQYIAHLASRIAQSVARPVSRQRLPRLRPPLGDDFAAWADRRHAVRVATEGGGPLR